MMKRPIKIQSLVGNVRLGDVPYNTVMRDAERQNDLQCYKFYCPIVGSIDCIGNNEF